MCGLAGFIGYSDYRLLAETANSIQNHRGPDYQGVWSDDYIALAHQRLSIIDLSARSNQPMEKDGLVIVFNGEIYNYLKLRKDLSVQHGVAFKTQSDTEVVLEAYRAYGSSCVEGFIGMFAFAIYEPGANRIYIARDHFGIKPLFYTAEKGHFAFASELKTLAGVRDHAAGINHRALIASLNYLWVPGNETVFKGIMKLPPGHYMTVDRDQSVRMARYARPFAGQVMSDCEADVIAELDSVLKRSISRHMVADVPVSSFLSGGLDSSLISVLALDHTDRLSTYTIATNAEDKQVERMPDDETYARKLANEVGFDHNEIVIHSDIVQLLPEMVRTLDEPIGDPAALNTFLICKDAHSKGVKVLLSGMGADEIFFGYRRQKATLMAARYQTYVPTIVRRAIRGIIEKLPVKLNGKGLRLVRWAKKFLSFAELPLARSYMQSYSYYNRNELEALLGGRYSREIDSLYAEHDQIFNSEYAGDPINQMCNTDIQMFMIGLNLTYTDRASMASSVEVRVPFIDKEVIDVAMRISGGLKYRKGESKYILKKVAEKYLPNEIIYRPKASFGAPIRSWISGALKSMVDDVLSEDNLSKRGLFDGRYVKKLIEEDRRGNVDNAYRIYQLLTIELWFREYLDKPAGQFVRVT